MTTPTITCYRVDIRAYSDWLKELPLEHAMGSCVFTSDDVVTVGRVSADGQTAYGVSAPVWGVSVEWMPTEFLIKEMS